MILLEKGSYFIKMLRSKVMEYVKNIRMSHILYLQEVQNLC